MISTIGAIAAGGAAGAVARHTANSAVALLFKSSSFPWGILTINVAGCFAMGVLVALFAGAWNAPQDLRAFLTVGFLGGFTTFSAFSLDFMSLWTRGDVLPAFAYAAASVLLSLAAVFLGSWLAWRFIA